MSIKHFKRNKNSWLLFVPHKIIANNFCPLKWALCVSMNYDEFVKEVQKYDSDSDVAKLLRVLKDWKLNNDNVVQLQSTIERFFGHSWIESEETHNHLYKLWSSFNTSVTGNIGGMTMNERLFWFGLFERFDGCQSEPKKQLIYSKLSANA